MVSTGTLRVRPGAYMVGPAGGASLRRYHGTGKGPPHRLPATMADLDDIWLPSSAYTAPVQGADLPGASINIGPDGVVHARPAEHIAQLPEYYAGVKISTPGDGTVRLGNTYNHLLFVAMYDEIRGTQCGRGTLKPMAELALEVWRLPRRWWLAAWGVADVPHPRHGLVRFG